MPKPMMEFQETGLQRGDVYAEFDKVSEDIARDPVASALLAPFKMLYPDQIELDPVCAVRRYAGPGADNKEIERIGSLADSFWEHGQAQPILVRPPKIRSLLDGSGGKYRLIAGERRWRAAQRDGLELACYIRDVDDTSARALAFEENYRRKNFSPVDMALLFIDARKALGDPCPPEWSELVRAQFGVSRATVTQHIRVYKYFQGEPEMLRKIHTGEVRMNAALAMLPGAPQPAQKNGNGAALPPASVIEEMYQLAQAGNVGRAGYKSPSETSRTMPRAEAGKTKETLAEPTPPLTTGKSHKIAGMRFMCVCGFETAVCPTSAQAEELINSHFEDHKPRPKTTKSKNR